jgi:biotin carboxyl carrier protein
VKREKKLRSLRDEELHSVGVEVIDDGYRVDGRTTVVRGPEARVWSVVMADGRSLEAQVILDGSEIEVAIEGARFRFSTKPVSRAAARRDGAAGRVEVKAPMPGRVVKVLVSPGERVSEGQPILLFEAMKMQNELRSPQEGVVADIAVAGGQAVEARERLYILESA